MKAEDSTRDYTESAEGAGDQFRQVVAGHVLDDLATAAGERAIGQRDGDADDEVAQSAEARTQSAAVGGRQDAADSRFVCPQWIERKALPVLSESFLQSLNGAARLGGNREVRPSVLEDLVETSG